MKNQKDRSLKQKQKKAKNMKNKNNLENIIYSIIIQFFLFQSFPVLMFLLFFCCHTCAIVFSCEARGVNFKRATCIHINTIVHGGDDIWACIDQNCQPVTICIHLRALKRLLIHPLYTIHIPYGLRQIKTSGYGTNRSN